MNAALARKKVQRRVHKERLKAAYDSKFLHIACKEYDGEGARGVLRK